MTDKKDAIKATKRANRTVFFKRGGTPKMWSGGNKKFTDRKKQANKEACRGRIGRD